MIDSLQLKNILDSLSVEMKMKTDSLGFAISQPIVEAMGKTNWWMWVITAVNALVVGYFSYRLWKTNQNQLRLALREEYRDLHLVLLQINNLSDTIMVDVMVGIGTYRVDIVTDKMSNIIKTIDSINGMNIHTLLSKESVNKLNEITFSLRILQGSCNLLNSAIKVNGTEYIMPITALQANSQDKALFLREALSCCFEKEKIILVDNFMKNILKFISLCDEHKLHKVTEKYCNIYTLIK